MEQREIIEKVKESWKFSTIAIRDGRYDFPLALFNEVDQDVLKKNRPGRHATSRTRYRSGPTNEADGYIFTSIGRIEKSETRHSISN